MGCGRSNQIAAPDGGGEDTSIWLVNACISGSFSGCNGQDTRAIAGGVAEQMSR